MQRIKATLRLDGDGLVEVVSGIRIPVEVFFSGLPDGTVICVSAPLEDWELYDDDEDDVTEVY